MMDILNEKEKTILNYLTEKVRSGKRYLDSKYIAKETGSSSRFIGAILYKLSQKKTNLKIVQYAHSGSKTTWEIDKEEQK
jgi:hypothetical protein